MVATRGEDYLRIKCCTPEELQSDMVAEYCEEIVKELRTELVSDIKRMTEITLTRSREYEKFDLDIKKCYQQDKGKKKEETILSATIICYLIFFFH